MVAERGGLRKVTNYRRTVVRGPGDRSVDLKEIALREALERIAEEQDTSSAWVIRQSARMYVRAYEKRVGHAVYFPTGAESDSERADSERGHILPRKGTDGGE